MGRIYRPNKKRLLLPGDVRTYEKNSLPGFQDIYAVFAHVFLGREAALEKSPPLLENFAEWHAGFSPEKIIITHLYELGREPKDCWMDIHADMVREYLKKHYPDIKVIVPEMFVETDL